VKRTIRTCARPLSVSTPTNAAPDRVVIWTSRASLRDAGPAIGVLAHSDHGGDHLPDTSINLGRLFGREGIAHAASVCSMGEAWFAMKSTIRRAVFKVSDRSAFRFAIRLASPIERRPNVEGFNPCFEQNRSIWARMSASLASVVTMQSV